MGSVISLRDDIPKKSFPVALSVGTIVYTVGACLPIRSRSFQRCTPPDAVHPDRVVQNLTHLDRAHSAVTPTVPIGRPARALARRRLLQLKAEGRVRRLVTIVPATPTTLRCAEGMRAGVLKVRLQCQVCAGVGVRLLVIAAAAAAVAGGREKGGGGVQRRRTRRRCAGGGWSIG